VNFTNSIYLDISYLFVGASISFFVFGVYTMNKDKDSDLQRGKGVVLAAIYLALSAMAVKYLFTSSN